MRRLSTILMCFATFLLLTACGKSVSAKLQPNNGDFNAVVTGKSKAKKVYWQVDDTIHSVKTTNETFTIKVPYQVKANRMTLSDQADLTNPTYLDGPKTTSLISWFNFIAQYNPLAQKQGIGVFDTTPVIGIRTDQVDEQTAIAMNVSDSQILGISIKALDATKNPLFKKYLTTFTTSLGTNTDTIDKLVTQAIKNPNQLKKTTNHGVLYTAITMTGQKQSITQVSMSHAQ
ncbi:hypothetical protein [Latilactobacillus fuchuensis]|uniref:hypothetical protein n=1 Tax=Latilactobacillus fuchuensis TaxID=164393 RepID=UPI0020C82378|nr:hypothetical protein [Latilactobacillus fuchuensis]MCP8858414.1 hypothetical protein [Latilactobacillus fuchuensis]